MKGEYSLTDEELMEYADEHIQYELDMLLWSAGILASLGPFSTRGNIPQAIHNALLNSFSLHARNLTNFLYSHTKGTDYKNDIILEDYVDEEAVKNNLKLITPLLESVLVKASKQVAHLSIERIKYEQSGKGWTYIDIANEILTAFSSIAHHIQKEKMSEDLRRRLSTPNFATPSILVKTGELNHSVEFSLKLNPDGNTIEMIRYK